MRKGTTIMICVSLALFAIGVTLYPLISNYYAEVNRSLIETKYTKAVEQMDDAEIIGARMDAQAYNATLLTITDKPYTKEALQQAMESYDDLLNVRGDGIMGYLEIPKLGVELPIFHGTGEETLDRGLGHLLGSSLPVGGTGTHCVITGHSGLAGRRMFSDLDKLALMDVFYLKVLDETLAYKVMAINTVLPVDTSELAIDPRRDNVTLVTCTPYGVNTHRLLVRGERINYEIASERAEKQIVEEISAASTWEDEYRRGVGIGMLCIAFVITLAGAARIIAQKSRIRAKTKAGNLRPASQHAQRKWGKHEAS